MLLICEDAVLSTVALRQSFPLKHPTDYLALQLVAVENNQSFIQNTSHGDQSGYSG